MGVFGGKAVVNTDNLKPGARADFCTDIVVAAQPAHNKTTAVQVDDGWLHAGIGAAWDTADRFILRGDTVGVAPMKAEGHCIIDIALLCDAAGGRIFRVAGVCARNERPNWGVDKGLIICHCHDARGE